MEQNNDLTKLASVVEDMLSRFNKLKEEKEDLLLTLAAKEEQIKELQESVSSLNEEKSDVYERVSGILGSIDEWEKSQLAEEKKSPEEKTSETATHADSQLFSMDV
ncbi:MAG: DUF904 domain-containing protein [Desulfobulbaceae bacterium]|nr:DUF904 domain-containing protein [Desulfobulbaceae bacterium]